MKPKPTPWRSGDQLTARRLNTLIGTEEGPRLGAGSLGRIRNRDSVLHCRNGAGENCPIYAPVEITGRNVADSDILEFQKPTGTGPYGIALQPISDGKVGLVALSGGPYKLRVKPGATVVVRNPLTPTSGQWYCEVGNGFGFDALSDADSKDYIWARIDVNPNVAFADAITYVDEGNPDTNYYTTTTSAIMYAENNGGTEKRILIAWDIPPQGLDGVLLQTRSTSTAYADAWLHVQNVDGRDAAGGIYIDAITGEWNPRTVTWNTMPAVAGIPRQVLDVGCIGNVGATSNEGGAIRRPLVGLYYDTTPPSSGTGFMLYWTVEAGTDLARLQVRAMCPWIFNTSFYMKANPA